MIRTGYTGLGKKLLRSLIIVGKGHCYGDAQPGTGWIIKSLFATTNAIIQTFPSETK